MAGTTSGSERSGLLLLLVCKQWSLQHLYFCCFLISKALAVPFTPSHKEIPQILNALDSPLVIPQSQDIWLCIHSYIYGLSPPWFLHGCGTRMPPHKILNWVVSMMACMLFTVLLLAPCEPYGGCYPIKAMSRHFL